MTPLLVVVEAIFLTVRTVTTSFLQVEGQILLQVGLITTKLRVEMETMFCSGMRLLIELPVLAVMTL